MKKAKLLLLSTLFSFLTFYSFSQDKTGTVYFIRATGYVGSAVNFRVYLDDTLLCKLKNKTYSVHSVAVGKHVVSAQNSGLSTRKKSAPFEINVQEGQITYVDVAWANRVYCQEITPNSATMILKKTKQTTNCVSKD